MTVDKSHYGNVPFEVPESWVWCRLGEIAQHNTGKTLDKSRNTGNLQKYITTSNLYWGYFVFTELREMLIEDKELERCRRVDYQFFLVRRVHFFVFQTFRKWLKCRFLYS